MKRSLKVIAVLVMSIFAGSVMAGAIHTWSSGEILNSSDLNANFQHIHNLMVGGHGGRLVDADVNGSANIAQSKISGLTTIATRTAKASALIKCYWTGATCTVVSGWGISSVTRAGQGVYNVNLSYTATDASYAVLITDSLVNPDGGTTGTENVLTCQYSTLATTILQVDCRQVSSPASRYDGFFSITIYDDN